MERKSRFLTYGRNRFDRSSSYLSKQTIREIKKKKGDKKGKKMMTPLRQRRPSWLESAAVRTHVHATLLGARLFSRSYSTTESESSGGGFIYY